MRDPCLHRRTAGVLLHPTSLPSVFGTGDLGDEARKFVDFLEQAGQTFWQMLPIHPVGAGDSPYDSPSAFAGAEHLISADGLRELELITADEAAPKTPAGPQGRANYLHARSEKIRLLELAFERFSSQESSRVSEEFQAFSREEASWVWDYALFTALKEENGGKPWYEWPEALRRREGAALEAAHVRLISRVRFQVFSQFCFHRDFSRLRAYAERKGVRLMGDVPMFVAHDSVDVWANQHAFYLDDQGQRTVQAGVPPDYFSEEGQLWGNPIYRWDTMAADGCGWWMDRLRRELRRFDVLRLDHFIAFCRYWEVPMNVPDAKSGRYVKGPSYRFFERAREALGGLPFVAEDLGIVTREVEELRRNFHMPGMKVLQFAFSEGAESYLPHRYEPLCAAYTGTHDNNTTRGYVSELVAQKDKASRVEAERLLAILGTTEPAEAAWGMIRLLFSSQAYTAIVPVQDLLAQGASERMNVPGVATGNWGYRLAPGALTPGLAETLHLLTKITQRLPQS